MLSFTNKIDQAPPLRLNRLQKAYFVALSATKLRIIFVRATKILKNLFTRLVKHQDARQLNAVKPSRQDEKVFAECRTIVTALAQELGKIANPQT